MTIPRITSPGTLAAAWQFIDGGHGYSAPQVFALMIDADGTVVPSIVQVYDEGPELDAVESVSALIGCLDEAFLRGHPGRTIAVLRARPGGATMTPSDERWCRALHRALRDTGADAHPVYFGTDDGVGPVPGDVLIDAA